ncbi:MAG: hypothetical protein AB1453_02070 [Chloroflexota bacterium]
MKKRIARRNDQPLAAVHQGDGFTGQQAAHENLTHSRRTDSRRSPGM